MRLNDNIAHPSVYPSPARSLLRGVISEITHSFDVAPNIDIRNDQVQQAAQHYFTKFYTKTDFSGVLAQDILSPDTKLSTIEAEIINFILSDKASVKKYVFRDHAGRGKSTILKYISYFLHKTEPKLAAKMVPVYISLKMHEATINSMDIEKDLECFLDGLIKEACFTLARDYFVTQSESILCEANDYNRDLQGRFPESRRQTFKEDPEQALSELSSTELIQVCKMALSVYSKEKRSVVILLDDADNFRTDIQRTCLAYLDKLIAVGFKAAIAIRFSSWEALENDRRDREPEISTPIQWSDHALKKLLSKRLKNARKINLQTPSFTLQAPNSRSITDAFIDLLSATKVEELLTRTSNFNLHSLMRKFDIIASSSHFDDKYLIQERMLDHTVESEHGARMWVVFHMLFGNYNGSYKTDDHGVRAGILNCFCNQNGSLEPYTFFIRVLVLARLAKHQAESTALSVVELKEELSRFFDYDLHLSEVIERTLYRLVQSALILTRSCKRYQDSNSVSEHIMDDWVYISETGQFYSKTLINMIDYLYFMKDDINWPSSTVVNFVPAKVRTKRIDKYKNTLRALKQLMALEYQMLSNIRDKYSEPGAALPLQKYINDFSARSLYGETSTIMFSEKMLNHYEEYLAWSLKNQDYKQMFNDELTQLNQLKDGYQDIIKAYTHE